MVAEKTVRSLLVATKRSPVQVMTTLGTARFIWRSLEPRTDRGAISARRSILLN